MTKLRGVLSLFDGISCGQVALVRAGIEYDKYYSSEIDKFAIKIAQKNFPNTIQLGDIEKIDFTKYQGEIDLLLGGSPCQGFSFAGKQLNFDDPRSKLFFEFVRALKEVKPKYFLFENVRMKKEYEDVITEYLNVKPIFINSSLVSAQNRKRLYWTNIPIAWLPEDKGILLKDIVLENTLTEKKKSYCVDAHYSAGTTAKYYQDKHRCQVVFESLKEYVVPFDQTLQILEKEVERGKIGYFGKDSQANRIYYIHNKAVTLCGEGGGGAAKMGQYLFGCITPRRINQRQKGQRFNTGEKAFTLTTQDGHGILIEGYIRKLTPVECERLQTLPDNYTEGISNTQRYKALGNGWTVDVIVHILSGLKE